MGVSRHRRRDGGGRDWSLDSRIILALREPGDLNNPIGSKNVEEAVRDVTALGGTTLVIVVTVVAVLAFLFHKKQRHALVMAGAVLAVAPQWKHGAVPLRGRESAGVDVAKSSPIEA
ncbi:MAG: hypothetical protein QM775_32670 [Pirellulales bacterium]